MKTIQTSLEVKLAACQESLGIMCKDLTDKLVRSQQEIEKNLSMKQEKSFSDQQSMLTLLQQISATVKANKGA